LLHNCPSHVHATTQFHTLSLHDALPIYSRIRPTPSPLTSSTDATSTTGPGRCTSTVSRSDYTYDSTIGWRTTTSRRKWHVECWTDRKSTRLNSSHVKISYAVFCLKKKTG